MIHHQRVTQGGRLGGEIGVELLAGKCGMRLADRRLQGAGCESVLHVRFGVGCYLPMMLSQLIKLLTTTSFGPV